MSDGGRGCASFGAGVWKSSQKWSVQRSVVRSIALLGLATIRKRRQQHCHDELIHVVRVTRALVCRPHGALELEAELSVEAERARVVGLQHEFDPRHALGVQARNCRFNDGPSETRTRASGATANVPR